MLQYKSVQGQSIWDVCLNTYGTFDFMRKFLDENGIDNIDVPVYNAQVFTWDETLVVDQRINQLSQNSNIIYATKVLPNEVMKTTVQGQSSEIILGGNNIGGSPTDGAGGGGEGVITPATLSIFIGLVDDLQPSEAVVKALTNRAAIKETQSIVFNCDTRRFCLAYPTYFGAITSIIDTNGFEIKSGFSSFNSNYTIEGQIQNYTILTLSRKASVSNFTVTFLF